MSRPPCIVIAPWHGRSAAEAEKTDRAISWLIQLGWAPIFLPYALERALNDSRPSERSAALQCSVAVVQLVARDPRAACFVVSEAGWSGGMKFDVETWEASRAHWSRLHERLGQPVFKAAHRLVTFGLSDSPEAVNG